MADKLLKSIKFPTLPDRYVIGDTSLSEEGAAAEAKAVGEALATKADTKGRYEDLIAGGAEQLMADEYETDKEPYLFRTTGGSADVGNREYLDKIVGGTVAWNQLVQNGNFADTSVWGTEGYGTLSANGNVGTFTISQATTSARIEQTMNPIKGHKYLAIASIKPNKAFDVVMSFRTTGAGTYIARQTMTANAWNYIFGVRNAVDSDLESNVFRVYPFLGTQTVEVGDTIQFRDIICIDLTQMFGSTIADYIYSLEQANAGAGVAFFKSLFPKPYYAYNAGELKSVKGLVSHDMVGFNAWDEEWESGAINGADGSAYADASKIRSKNFIPVVGGTTYYVKAPSVFNYAWYNADKLYISGDNSATANYTRTAPVNARYLKFSIGGTTYNHDICINLSDPTRNGEYEPYQKHTYPLDSSLTLRGVPKLVDGKLAFDGDIYPPSGEVSHRYNETTITDSMITMVGVSYSNVVYADIHVPSDGKKEYTKVGMLAKYGVAQSQSGTWDSATHVGNVYMNAARDTFWVGFAHGTSLADMKTALVGMTLLYELATPTTETADGYEQYQRCDPSGTEEFVTTGIVPVGHETRYPHDLKKKIETAPDSPSTDGTYLMKRSGGKNTYMALPSTPSANGAYVLTVTVSGGSASYSWTAKE